MRGIVTVSACPQVELKPSPTMRLNRNTRILTPSRNDGYTVFIYKGRRLYCPNTYFNRTYKTLPIGSMGLGAETYPLGTRASCARKIGSRHPGARPFRAYRF